MRVTASQEKKCPCPRGRPRGFDGGATAGRRWASAAPACTPPACPENPPGCLLVQGALACGAEAAPVRRELAGRRQAGELPPDADADALALYFSTVIRGLGVSGAGGAGRPALEDIARRALCAWPAEEAAPPAHGRGTRE